MMEYNNYEEVKLPLGDHLYQGAMPTFNKIMAILMRVSLLLSPQLSVHQIFDSLNLGLFWKLQTEIGDEWLRMCNYVMFHQLQTDIAAFSHNHQVFTIVYKVTSV